MPSIIGALFNVSGFTENIWSFSAKTIKEFFPSLYNSITFLNGIFELIFKSLCNPLPPDLSGPNFLRILEGIPLMVIELIPAAFIYFLKAGIFSFIAGFNKLKVSLSVLSFGVILPSKFILIPTDPKNGLLLPF